MTNKLTFKAVDRTLCDLTNKNEPFGGIVFVMLRDFRQVFSVIPWGSRANIVYASIKNSYLWESVEVFRLLENMWASDVVAVHLDLGNHIFADWLLCLGNNKLETIDEDYIKCLDMMVLLPTDTQGMVVVVYPRLHEGQSTNEYLHECAILAPCNKEVLLINAMVLSYLPGAQVDFLSADFAEDTEVANTYPFEFLNTLEVSGMPSHKLSLKIGTPVILLRNFDPSAGLCNGTHLIVRRFTMQVVEAKIIIGKWVGNVAFIPCIKFISDNNGLPFTFTRKQFPLQLAYAMTINKSQGQTLFHVGLHIADDVFSHGQLYVAFSRAKAPENVKVQLPNTVHGRIGLMRNVVYEEALLWSCMHLLNGSTRSYVHNV